MADIDVADMVAGNEPPIRTARRKLARKAVEYARNQETAIAPAVMMEDVSFFLDSAMFDREYQAMFRETPLVACLSSELAEPGAFRTFDDAGVPMFVSRGKDGQVRAFLNVCPHRGARIVREDAGKANRFACRFHGWTFDSTGKAIGVPDEKHFCGEIDAQKHLFECPAEERHGLVFVQATAGSTMDLDAHLGDFGRELDMIELLHAEPVHTIDLPVPGNWKYGMDTFFETYHLNSLHRDTFKGLFSPTCVFETFGKHHRYTFTPLSVTDWIDQPESEWKVDLLPLQFFLWPNLIMAVGGTSPTGSIINIHRIFPQSVDHFVSKMAYYALHGVKSPAHRAEIDASYKVAMRALVDDDYSVTGESHGGLPTLPAGTKMPIGRQEIGVQNFHRNIHAAIMA